MWIMTSSGWKQLTPSNVIPAPAYDGRYRGELPSPQVKAFIASLEADIEMIRQRRAM
jgi:hypothetical protein